MTIHSAVSVYDVATETFARPFYVTHTAQAVRSFTDEVNREDSEISRHPQDYELWEMGNFDDQTGAMNSNPVRICRAIDLKKD